MAKKGRKRPAPDGDECVLPGQARPRWKALRLVGHVDTGQTSNDPIYVEESDPEEHGCENSCKRQKSEPGEHAPGLEPSDVLHRGDPLCYLTLAVMFTMTLPALLADVTIPSTGLPSAAVELLRDVFQVPRTLFLILGVLHQSEEYSDARDLYLCEFFCGAGAVWRNVQEICGLPTAGYDIAHGPSEDFCGRVGFINALQYWRRLMAEAWAWLGTVCSTWVFLCLSSTGRSTSVPRGNTRQSCVREGNQQVGRSALVMALQYATKRGWILEQPGTSLMLKSHPMRWVKRCAEHIGSHFFIVETYMGAFASQHVKHTLLVSNHLNIYDLKRARPTGMPSSSTVTEFVDKNGKRRCTGNGAALKATQQYTETFGCQVAAALKETLGWAPLPYATWKPTEPLPGEDDDDLSEEHPWIDVELEPCLQILLLRN